MLLPWWLWAGDACESKLFTFQTAGASNAITVRDVVVDLARTCHFSVLYEDDEIKKRIRKRLGLVQIKDYTLEEMFEFLLADHNIFYEYDPQKRILRLAYVRTRSFHIDYVNLSELTTESTKSITVGATNTLSGYGNGGYGGITGTTNSGSNNGGMYGDNGGDNSDQTVIRTVTEFKFWENFKRQIDAILQRDEDSHTVRSKALVNKEAGIVTVTGTRRQIARVAEYIKHVTSRLHKQIMLEASLIALRYADANTTGVDWSRFDVKLRGVARKGGAFLLPDNYSLGYQVTMDGIISFLQHYGDVHTISNPKVMTLNNQPAVINVGDQINYKYQTGTVSNYNNVATATNTYALGSVFVGLTLQIVPEVTDDGFILLRINPVVSEELNKDGELDYNQYANEDDSNPIIGQPDAEPVRTMPPDVKIKQMTSIVKVKNGHKVVIGGLISKRVIHANTSVPFLSDIPFVGRAFRHTGTQVQKVELIVVITQHVVDGTQMPSIDEALERWEKP
jgi:general secretion pathway protein D